MSDIHSATAFFEAAHIGKYGWNRKRKSGTYADFEIVACRQKDWWYRDFIGETFFGRFIHKTWYQEQEIEVVRLVNSVEYYGRIIPIGDLKLL